MNTSHPRKIHVEITTRCNLNCRMCVKYSAGNNIPEGDMSLTVFRRLIPALAHADKLVLNGLGEPLLHPDLEAMVRIGREVMPADAEIGFQSNGLLLDNLRAQNLIEAGLSTICLSLDSLQTTPSSRLNGEHGVAAVAGAAAVLAEARKNRVSSFRIGLEMVLTRDTVRELPAVVEWAAAHGIDYILTTHLLLYDASTEELSIFNPNTQEAVQLFTAYNDRAKAVGINLASSLAGYLKLSQTAADQPVARFFSEMQAEAREKDIRLHLQSLVLHEKKIDPAAVHQLFQKSRDLAKHKGIALFLPPLHSSKERVCAFMADDATFIAGNGDVMPCHFLWHSYSCQVLRESVQVEERTFGNINRQSLQTIWQNPAYLEFRGEAARSEYAQCWSCSLGPCSNLVNDNSHYANDCYGSRVPCGHCQWNLGGIRCL